jgi:hypothetical protein
MRRSTVLFRDLPYRWTAFCDELAALPSCCFRARLIVGLDIHIERILGNSNSISAKIWLNNTGDSNLRVTLLEPPLSCQEPVQINLNL